MRAAGVAACLLVAALTACSAPGAQAPVAVDVGAASTAATQPTASATPEPPGPRQHSPGPAASPRNPRSSRPAVPPAPPVPAATAGPLSRADVPAARDLGRGWREFVDPGDVADGYVGNGEFVRERGVEELAASLVPLGCPGVGALPPLPVAQHALEATYRGVDGDAAVAVVLDYPSPEAATTLLTRLADLVSRCSPPAAGEPAGPGRTVAEVRRSSGSVLVDVRHEVGTQAVPGTFYELGARSGSRVGLLLVQRGPGDPAPPVPALLADLQRRLAAG